MISGYEQFKEDRDEVRLRLRSEIYRQTIDQTLRGRSVWKAFRDMSDQPLFTDDGTPRTAREMWRATYRIPRKCDAAINKSIQDMTRQWVGVLANGLYKPRKIDELL